MALMKRSLIIRKIEEDPDPYPLLKYIKLGNAFFGGYHLEFKYLGFMSYDIMRQKPLYSPHHEFFVIYYRSPLYDALFFLKESLLPEIFLKILEFRLALFIPLYLNEFERG